MDSVQLVDPGIASEVRLATVNRVPGGATESGDAAQETERRDTGLDSSHAAGGVEHNADTPKLQQLESGRAEQPGRGAEAEIVLEDAVDVQRQQGLRLPH